MQRIDFTPIQVQQIKLIAAKRNEFKKQRDSRDLIRHEMGVFGEFACRVHLDTTMDYKIYKQGGDKGRPDCMLPDGRQIQVKTRIPGGTLLMKQDLVDNLGPKDLAILIWMFNDKHGCFVGWADKEHIVKHAKLDYTMVRKGLHKVPSYECDYSVMKPMSELYEKEENDIV